MANPTYTASVAADLATLTREADPPSGELGYGIDLHCVTDVTPDFAETDPNTPVGIVEATIRRWTTPRGTLPDDLDYGHDVRVYCSRAATNDDLRTIALSLAAEATKDDRIEAITIDLVATLTTRTLHITARVTPADPALQVFTFTFSVDDTQALLDTLEITPTAAG
jgi:hypothetical protein